MSGSRRPIPKVKSFSIFSGISADTSSRTGKRKRLRCSSRSSVRIRSPASSSRSSISASRVTRKRKPSLVFIFGKRWLAFAATTCSIKANRPFFSLIGISRGNVGGSFIRAKRFCRNKCRKFFCVKLRFGSMNRPKFRLRLEIYGKGWLESTDCGVKIGKRLSRKYLSSFFYPWH